MSDINYHDKYLKYKKKYLDLLDKIYGGAKNAAKDEAKPVPKTAAQAKAQAKKEEQEKIREKLMAPTKKGVECNNDLDCKPREEYCLFGSCEPLAKQGQYDPKSATKIFAEKKKEATMTTEQKRQAAIKDAKAADKEEEKKKKEADKKAKEAQAKAAKAKTTRVKYNYEFDVNELLSESSVN
tara:strand:- start:30 stop:575 length:546 start_codon:yes stop_codon:yes gene_type:complete